jgi:hypothetical protein
MFKQNVADKRWRAAQELGAIKLQQFGTRHFKQTDVNTF